MTGKQLATKGKVARARTKGAKKEVREEVPQASVTVRGILIPVEWDEDGNALAVAVSAPGEKEYIVQQDSKGKELLALMRREIEIVGVIGKERKGRKTIAVRTYYLVTTAEREV